MLALQLLFILASILVTHGRKINTNDDLSEFSNICLPLPEINNGEAVIIKNNGWPSNACHCRVTCNSGFTLSGGSANVYCIDGKWTAEFPSCIDICEGEDKPTCGTNSYCELGKCKCLDGWIQDEQNNSTNCVPAIPDEIFRFEVTMRTGSWKDMRRYCKSRGGDLLHSGLETMESRRELIYNMLGYGAIVNSFWIGIRRKRGQWISVDGTTLGDEELNWNLRDTIEYRKYPRLNLPDARGRCTYINVDWFMRDSRNDLKTNRNNCDRSRAAICQFKC